MSTITPCLWFDTHGEEAAEFYTSIFPNSRIVRVARYPEGSPYPAGSVMTVEFELDGQPYTALNGGPRFTFTEAISLQVDCRTQEDVDRYWEKLGEGGEHGPCGWLRDRYGLSWQIVPRRLTELLTGADADAAARVMAAMMTMSKIEIAQLEDAAAGAAA